MIARHFALNTPAAISFKALPPSPKI